MARKSINFRECRDGLWADVRAKAQREGTDGTAIVNRLLLDYLADDDDPAQIASRIAADATELTVLLRDQ